jgi:signal transduction histidine kinase
MIEATAFPVAPPGSVVVSLRDVTGVHTVERLRRDFVANASHELKTPVASIRALSETLREVARHDPEAMPHLLFRLEQEATRLAALVNDLLSLSRLEAGPMPRSLVIFNHVVEAEMQRLRKRAEAAGLRWVLKNSAGDVLVSGSQADLSLLVSNLLDNAIQYTPKEGEVLVALEAADGEAELIVQDNGVGIPAQDIGRVFERFYRVDTARSRQTGGTGLGLSIVRNVVEAHGGTVELASQLGVGSTFTVRLPLPVSAERRWSAVRRENGSPDLAP